MVKLPKFGFTSGSLTLFVDYPTVITLYVFPCKTAFAESIKAKHTVYNLLAVILSNKLSASISVKWSWLQFLAPNAKTKFIVFAEALPSTGCCLADPCSMLTSGGNDCTHIRDLFRRSLFFCHICCI